MMRFLLAPATGLIFVLNISIFSFAQTTVQGNFIYKGLARNYRIYIPAIYSGSTPVPLILNLHGYGSNNTQQEAYGDFRPIADTANFIIVHPNGTLDGSGNLYWNTFGWSTIDDVGFLSALIDTISADYMIDPDRIYSTGMSNGGFMSYDLACSLSNRIAAIASVTGSMTPGHKNSCNPLHPVPVMQIHGTADATVPYTGSSTMINIDTLVSFWVQFNSCSLTPAITNVPNSNTSDGCTAENFLYDGGSNGSAVELYKVTGGGHSWPGAPININVTNMDFKANVEIWRFFRKYKLSDLTLVNEPAVKAEFSIYPNPSSGKFYMEVTEIESVNRVEIYNILGVKIHSMRPVMGRNEINVTTQPPGVYFVQTTLTGAINSSQVIITNSKQD